ncbi:hypothetical protein ATCC90586_005325 [Pythium insidiosum]|nr:hypothetical protein ATCC90586_005325 [Pythium insidiosum]
MLKISLLSLLAGSLIPSAVQGHGFLISPEPTWVINPFYDKNAPASFYFPPQSQIGRNPLDVFPNLRFIIDRESPNIDVSVIRQNANRKCGSPWCDNNPNSAFNGGRCQTNQQRCTKIAPSGGTCGPNGGGAYCPGTQCCSQFGFCGVGSPWCDSNPNSMYNGARCTAALLADDADDVQDARDKQAPQVGGAAATTDKASATAAATAGDSVPPLSSILTKRTFERIFPDAEGSVLTYEGLIEAAQSYSEFAQTANANINVLEVAYFLAHVAYTTQNLMYPGQPDGSIYNPDKYCQASKEHPCAPGASYYGRGPLYLRWNFRYQQCGNAIGVDLYNNPDLALSSSTIAWETGLWTWFDLGLHEISTLPDAFCGSSPTNPNANAERVARFKAIARILGVKGVGKLSLSCTDTSLDLLADEKSTTVLASARLMGAETNKHGNRRGLMEQQLNGATALVAGLAMTALVVLAVVKRKADATARAKAEAESMDYLLMHEADK